MMYQVFLSILETFIVFGVGAIAWKLKMIETGDLDKLSRLTLDLFFPMLTFSTITRTFDPDRLSELWVMPLLGIAIMLFGAGAGWIFKRFMKSRGHGREGTFHHICAINNYVFLPIIVLQNIYGERHVALLLLMNVGSTIGFWTIGVATFTGGGSWKQTLKSIFSINIAAVVAALLVSFLGIPVPEALDYMFKYLGDITVPLMLPFVGVGLTSTSVTAINVFDEIVALSGYSDLAKNILMESYLTTFNFLDFGKGSAMTYIVLFFALFLGIFYLRSLNKEVEY